MFTPLVWCWRNFRGKYIEKGEQESTIKWNPWMKFILLEFMDFTQMTKAPAHHRQQQRQILNSTWDTYISITYVCICTCRSSSSPKQLMVFLWRCFTLCVKIEIYEWKWRKCQVLLKINNARYFFFVVLGKAFVNKMLALFDTLAG